MAQGVSAVILCACLAVSGCRAAGVCGDGVVDVGEGCDDANVLSGDGCSAACELEDPERTRFLCFDVSLPGSGGRQMTRCCPAYLNPITQAATCSCDGQPSDSPAYVFTHTCERQDVNECLVANGGCAANALCVNTDGTVLGSDGFACVCPPGLFGDGYERCDTTQYAVVMELAVRNATAAGNHLSPAWIETKVAASGLVDLGEVQAVRASYVTPAGRRLLAVDYAHVAVTFEVADWDAMQRMSDAINAELIAAFLAQESSGLNQISVLQDTTTVVEEAVSGYSYTARNTPGFLVSNLSYASLPEDEWGAAQHLWRIATHFYAPPGFTSALFATRGHAATSPALHACAQSTDVCCLHRMNLDHRMGDFGAWVTANLAPLCTAAGGFPGAAVAAAPSETTLAAVAGEAWLTGVFNGLVDSAATLQPPSTLLLDISQLDVIDSLAGPANASSEHGTSYSFGVGMIFFRPSPGAAIFSVIGQAAVEVFTSDTMTFVASSNQDYSFLQYLDLVLYSVRLGAARAQFVRATFVLPEEMQIPDGKVAIPATSIQFATGEDVLSMSAWETACLSAENASRRDGSGLWDAEGDGTTRDLYGGALAQDCALRDASFCASVLVASGEDAYMHSIDIPLGDARLDLATEAPSYLFLRFVVEAEQRDPDPAVDASYAAISQVNAQLLVDESTVISLCEDTLSSSMRDTDFVRVSLAIGVQLEQTNGDTRDDVLFTDIVHTEGYETLKALDTSAQYTAVSVLDSLLTVALLGEAPFFLQEAHLGYRVAFDHVITVHLRSDEIYAQMNELVAAETAYTVHRAVEGAYEVRLSAAFTELCYGPGGIPDPTPDENLACAIQHPVVGRVFDTALAHPLDSDIDEDVAWLMGLLGNSEFGLETASALAVKARELYALDFRSRQAAWVVPTYRWPGQGTIGTVDRTLTFTAFSVIKE